LPYLLPRTGTAFAHGVGSYGRGSGWRGAILLSCRVDKRSASTERCLVDALRLSPYLLPRTGTAFAHGVGSYGRGSGWWGGTRFIEMAALGQFRYLG